MTRTLRDHDLAKWVGRFEKNAPITNAPTVLILEIRNGVWNLSGRPQGGAPASHEGDSNTYRWSWREDSLMLAWPKTTYGSYKGIPEEVFQRALYMTAEFSRAG